MQVARPSRKSGPIGKAKIARSKAVASGRRQLPSFSRATTCSSQPGLSEQQRSPADGATHPLVSGCLRHKRPPLRQRSRASLLVVLPGDEMPLLIKMIVDLSVNRTEFLKRLQASKALHRSLSSSKRLMRVLRPIVEAATDLVPIGGTDLIHRRGIGPTPVGDGSGANCLDTA
jgi:hypothetical protein